MSSTRIEQQPWYDSPVLVLRIWSCSYHVPSTFLASLSFSYFALPLAKWVVWEQIAIFSAISCSARIVYLLQRICEIGDFVK